jgi:hypothetical protein
MKMIKYALLTEAEKVKALYEKDAQLGEAHRYLQEALRTQADLIVEKERLKMQIKQMDKYK